MQTKFLVQNPHRIPVSKQVDVDGDGILHPVSIEGFEVHLLSQDKMSGTLVLRYYGAAAKEAEKLFLVDSVVTADFTSDAPIEAPAAEQA